MTAALAVAQAETSPLRRTFDGGFLNRVANDPAVRPWLDAGAGPADFGAPLRNVGNVGLVNEHGGFLLIAQASGLYEIHTAFLPAGRGPLALAAIREAFRWMFVHTDCTEIRTKTPQFNRAAMSYAERAGFHRLFERAGVWPRPDGSACGVTYWSLGFEQWLAQDDELEAHGGRFHAALKAAKAEAASVAPDHPDDAVHNRAVGAFTLMLEAGNAVKAAQRYNSFAQLAGFAPVTLLSLTPVVVDAGDALVGVRDGELDFLKVKEA